MRLGRRGVDILSLVLTSFVLQLCRTTVLATADEEQTVREWLEVFYRRAEERYFVFTSASWDFNVNITDENKQRMVSSTLLTAVLG